MCSEYTIKYPGRYKTEQQYSDVVIKALGNGEFLKLSDVAKIELGAQSYSGGSVTNGYPEVQYAQSSFNTRYPQYEMTLNVPLAKEVGVSVQSIFATLQGYIGSVFAADFSRFGKQYRVYVQALPEDRATESDLNNIYVRTASGEMTLITQFVTLKKVYGPQSVTRFNLFNSTKITAATAPGFSSGDVINAGKK